MITWCVFRCTNSGGYEDMKFVARLVLVLTLVVNYLFVIFIPSIGIHQAKEIMDPSIVGAWKGGVAQKNHAGGICALIMIFFTFDSRSMKKSLNYTVMVAALFFLYKTQSKTSMIMLAVSLMFGYIFRFYDPKYKYFIIPIISIPLCVLTIFLNIHWNTIIDPTFDPYSFTGRGAIWQAVVDWLREDNHWVLGSGFGSFWNIGDKGPIFSHATGWVVSIGNAHDGYLEILSTIGIFGLILALLAAFIIPIGKLLVTSNVPKPKASLCLGLLIFGFGQNFTESTLLDRDQFISVFIVFAVALVREITSPGALPRKLHYRPAKTRPLLAHG
jgi:O-antigen ligase